MTIKPEVVVLGYSGGHHPTTGPGLTLSGEYTLEMLDDVCPFCGRSDTYERYTELDNVKALVDPVHHKEDAYKFTWKQDDYYTRTEISEDGRSCSVSFIKKPKCWLQYPAEPWECTNDCALQRECRDQTEERVPVPEWEHGPVRSDHEERTRFLAGEPVDEEAWQKWINGDDEDAEEDYDETQEDYYRESLDKRLKVDGYSD
jgi:hypothetical protein